MDYLKLEIKGKTAVIKINREDKLNALNLAIMNELSDLFQDLKGNSDVSVIIITGSGEKAFAAGADIAELNNLNEKTGKDFSSIGQNVFNLIENMNKPVIAAVNGFALGGGCELAMACHIRIASENAKFGQPEINLGLIPGYGGTQRFTQLIGKARAMEYLLTGATINSSEALQLGLVNYVYPQNQLLEKTFELADKISSKSQFTIERILKAVNAGIKLSFMEGLEMEASLFGECCISEDFKEGTSAFLQKRKPQFKNR